MKQLFLLLCLITTPVCADSRPFNFDRLANPNAFVKKRNQVVIGNDVVFTVNWVFKYKSVIATFFPLHNHVSIRYCGKGKVPFYRQDGSAIVESEAELFILSEIEKYCKDDLIDENEE